MTFIPPNDKLRIEDENGFPFTLLRPLQFRSQTGLLVTVPEGFETDYASIPQALWAVLPPVGRYDRAAVLHDYLYVHNGVERSVADAILNEAMEVAGVSRVQRWIIYSGVRIGGWVPWKRYRDADEVSNGPQ